MGFEKICWLFPLIKIFPVWLLHQLPVHAQQNGEPASLNYLGYWFSNWGPRTARDPQQFSSSSIGLSDTNCVWLNAIGWDKIFLNGALCWNLCPFKGHWFEKLELLIQNNNWPRYQSFPERISQKNMECNLKWQQSNTKEFKLMEKKIVELPRCCFSCALLMQTWLTCWEMHWTLPAFSWTSVSQSWDQSCFWSYSGYSVCMHTDKPGNSYTCINNKY